MDRTLSHCFGFFSRLSKTQREQIPKIDPSMYVEQSWNWISRGKLRLSEILTSELKAAGVDTSAMGENGIAQGTAWMTITIDT